jgi:predicted ArsR family transcriptional regulator
MDSREIQVVVHTAPQQTVYNQPMEKKPRRRRPFLSRDIMRVLKKHPNLTRGEISIKVHAKNHSVKAVLFKLVASGKIECVKGKQTTAKTGPRMINVYCLMPQPQAESNHG